MEFSVFIAVSMDGFIARPDGSLDWLERFPGDPAEDYGYKEFLASVDCVVMGRNTYEKVLSFPEWPFPETPVAVLSSKPVASLAAGCFNIVARPPQEILRLLAERGHRRAYLDGGRTIQAFLEASLVGSVTLTKIPILLGSGIPLFGPLARDKILHHTKTRTFPNGFVQSVYEIRESGPA